MHKISCNYTYTYLFSNKVIFNPRNFMFFVTNTLRIKIVEHPLNFDNSTDTNLDCLPKNIRSYDMPTG